VDPGGDGMISTFAAGRYSATGSGESDALCFPRKARAAGVKRGVLFCHGAEDTAIKVIDPANVYRALVAKLVDQAQTPLEAADLGAVQGTSDVWGNSTGMGRMDDSWAWLKNANGGGAKTDKAILVGGSMGGLMAVNWASRNPTLVAAIVLVIPALDLQDIYVNDRGPGLQAEIQAAYGGAPDYATRSPMNLAASLTGIPTKIWYSTNDPVTPSVGTNATFAASVGSSCSTQSMGAVGHVFSAVDPDQVLNFVSPYL
jgi:dienelactone hydrolase